MQAKLQSLKSSSENRILHKSHRDHDAQQSQLAVEVHLAPSCEKCKVEIHRTPLSSEIETPPPKKLKTEELSSVDQPMTDAEIRKAISNALPEITDENCRDKYLKEPAGTIIQEYTRTSTSSKDDKSVSSTKFVVTIADGTAVVDYHSQVQKLALWFIENADDVDVAEESSGFWKVLYLFERGDSKGYTLVGYVTLFHFNAPFHKPTPGIIARICQALIFPPYQGQGHGTQLLQCIYDLAQDRYNEFYQDHQRIVQVNVEDPSPGYTLLRNAVDFKFLTQQNRLEWWPPSAMVQSSTNTTTASLLENTKAFVALSEDEASQVADKAKMIPRQVQIVYELVNLQLLLSATANDPNEELEKRFRLMVKKRLNREHREDMSGYPSKEEKKEYLNQLYEAEIKPYKAWLEKRLSKT